MKYFLSIILLLGLINVGQAQPFYGSNPTVNLAQQSILRQAKRSNKDIILFFNADWCHWCKKMKRETLQNEEVKKTLSKYLVYHINTDIYPGLIKEYKVGPIPSYIVVSKEGKILKRGVGFLSGRDFLEWLTKIPK